MKNVLNKDGYNEIMSRLDKVSPNNKPLWGSMQPAQMMHHITLSLEYVLGKYPIPDQSNFFRRTIVKRLAFSGMTVPKNVKTIPEIKVTEDKTFGQEKQRLVNNLSAVSKLGVNGNWLPSPVFGKLSGDEWGQIIYVHIDHHFKQFGV